MVLDQKRAVIPERLSLNVEVDEVMEAVSHDRAGTRAVGLGAAKNSKLHGYKSIGNTTPRGSRCSTETLALLGEAVAARRLRWLRATAVTRR